MRRQDNTYSQTGDWLMGTARRNPEALLLLAAGCVLLMRGGGSSPSRTAVHNRYSNDGQGMHGQGFQSSDTFRQSSEPSRVSSVRGGIARAAEAAGDYASDIGERMSQQAGAYADKVSDLTGRVSDQASAYAGKVSELASDATRNVVEQSDRFRRQAQATMQSGMDRVLRDQPLAVALVGLAAGAAVAAAFPATRIERRTLGPAHDALADAASRAGEAVKQAAGKAGEQLMTAAEQRGFTAQGLKDLASEVTGTFTDAVTGKSEDKRAASIVPDRPASRATSDTTASAFERDSSRSASLAGTSTEPQGRGRR